VLFGLKHMKLIAYSYFLWMVFVSPASGNVFVNLLSTLLGTLLVAIIINTIPRAVSGRFRIDQGAKFYLLVLV